MRCASCGTENAPDSRFCGGCGARLEPSRVAPTVRLPDDTPYAPPGGHIPTPAPGAMRLPTPPPGAMNIGNLPTPAPGSLSYPPNPRAGSIPPTNGPASIPPTNNPASIPPTNNPASIPPTNNRLASVPPTSNPASRPPSSSPGTVQRRAGTPPPSSPSLSMVPPRRNTAVIAILLVLDLGLAAAGAMLLVKGLAKPKAAPPPAKTELHGEAAAPAPTPVATAPATTPPPPAAEPVADSKPGGKPDKKPATSARTRETKPSKDTKSSTHADKDAGAKPGAPLDPYASAAPPAPADDQSQDIERMAAQSFGSFRSCLDNAVHGGPIRGAIRIAFLIEPDGHVTHAHAVVNTTTSDVLAPCLEQTIATWTFAPHSGPAASYERPFSYP